MNTETRHQLREFGKRRTQIHRQLKKAAAPVTNEIKGQKTDEALQNAVKILKENNIKLVAVAHIIARAIQDRQIHENIVTEHKERVNKQKEAEKEYARLRERVKNKIWQELNRLDVPFDFYKDDVIDHMKSEEKIKKLFRHPALGKLFETWSKKNEAAWRKRRWTKSDSDNPPIVYLNNFCLRIISLYEEHDMPLNRTSITVIEDLINAFSLSSKKQTYHTVHNRIVRLTR